MITLLAVLVLLALFLLAMTTFAATRSVSLLTTCNAVMMISAPILGGSQFTVAEYTTNTGNIFYAVAMFGLCVNFFIYGAAEAHAAIKSNLLAFVIVLGSVFALDYVHVLDGVFDASVRLAGARMVTFALIQPLHIHFLERRSRWPMPLHAFIVMLCMQILDAIIFFPIAFLGLLAPGKLLEYGMAGVITRSAVLLLSGPFLVALLSIRRGDPETDSSH